MGKLPNTIVRNGVYYLHVRVPKDLLPSYGKQFLTESLRTREKREALRLSQERMTALHQEFDDRLSRLAPTTENAADAPASSLSFAEIARQHAREVADREFADRAALFQKAHEDSSRLWKGELVALPQSSYFDHLVEDGDLDIVVGYIARTRIKDRVAELRRMLANGNLSDLVAVARARAPGINSARELVLARLIARAEIDALEGIVAGEPDAGIKAAVAPPNSPVEAPNSVAVPQVPARTGSGVGPRLSIVMADWMKDKEREGKWAAKTRNEREASAKAFIEICGDHPIATYAKADVKRFKDVLFDIPPNAHKKSAYKGLGLVAIAEKAAAIGDKKPAVQNVAKKMEAVSSLFFWARSNFDEVEINPFDGLKPKTETTPREERDPFGPEELKAIFAAPPFTGARSQRNWLEPGNEVLDSSGKFWVPLIAAYTGARLMEIVQLQKADVQRVGDVTFFNLTTEGEGDKKLKTRSSKRRIPVHPALINAGLLRMVAKVENPSDRLFPDVEIGPPENRASPASKLFIRLIKAAGVKSRRNCFHSFRHSFEDACRDAEIDGDVMDALQGHAQGGMRGRYGKGEFKLERLDASMRKIRLGLVWEGEG